MIRKMTTDELLARYKTGERDFAGVELIRIPERDGIEGSPIEGLEGADLRGINLRGANLEDLWLEGADLTGADLLGACLIRANLSNAVLRDANLFSVNLTWATCWHTDFRGACLSQMNATSAAFINAVLNYFEYAILVYADFEGATGRLCLRSHFNIIWQTTMPDGTVEEGPLCVWK